MFKIIKFLCLLLLPLAFVGCNSEIFVEPVDDIVRSISLSGDNGTSSFKIQKKGLMGVEFDNDVDYDAMATYFDREGEIIGGQSDIGDVARILYNSHTFALEFIIDGDNVEVKAMDNANSREIEVRANFNYGYVTKPVTIRIGQGRPLEMQYIIRDTGSVVDGTFERKIRRTYHNETDHPLVILLYPYRAIKSSLTLIPEERWTDGVGGMVSVPAYFDGEWNDLYPDEVEAQIGADAFYYSAMTPEVEESIAIPPYSTGVMELTLTMASLDTRYVAEVEQPNSQLMWMTFGIWQQLQPIDYQINLTIEE